MRFHRVIRRHHAPQQLTVQRGRHGRGVVSNFTGQFTRRRQQLVRLVDAAQQTALERFFGAEYTAGVDPLSRLHRADETRQEPAGAGFHGDAAAGKHKAELGVGRCHTNIRRQAHGHAHTHGRAVKGNDDRLGALIDTQRHSTAAITQVIPLGLILTLVTVEGITALLQIRTGTERTAGTGHDHDTHRIIGIGCVKGRNQITTHLAVEGVHAVRTVQRQREDTVLHLVVEGFVSHLGFPCLFECGPV